MAVLEDHERETLQDADRRLVGFQKALQAAAAQGALDQEAIDRLRRTAHEIAGRVNGDLSPQLDPEARDEIRRRLLHLVTIGDVEPGTELDVADRALIQAEAVRHIVRDLLQEQPPIALREAAAVVQALEEWLPGASIKDLAELLGMSDRNLQRKRSVEGPSTARMQLVARLAAILRSGWTDRGVIAWFHRPRLDLGGAKPIDLLDDPARERDLLLAARSGRVQGAA